MIFTLVPLGLAIVFVARENSVSSFEAALFVSPSNLSVKSNQTFSIDINVSATSDLYGWEFKLGYNTGLLELVSVTEGSFLNSSRDTYFVQKVISTEGYVLAGCTSLRNVAGADGNGTLATVEFRAKKLGSCTLDLYNTKLVNSAKQLMEHDEIDGTVTVSGCITVKVVYADGYPRSNAEVIKVWPYPYRELGFTNGSGIVQVQGALDPGDYVVQAYWPDSFHQFGPNAELIVDEDGNGDTVIRNSDQEITPPSIEILSSQNLTYASSSIPLTFTVYDYSPISWIGYSLDNQANVTITGNTTLTSLSDGTHEIVVYANDTFGNMGASNKICFTVSTYDIAVTNVSVTKTVIGQGYTLYINVTVQNEGIHTENLSVTAYANTTEIETKETSLTSGNSITITFTWNTTGFVKGNYTISAYVWPVLNETDTDDNTCTNDMVTVSIPGDADGDFKVDLYDAVGLLVHYGAKAGQPAYDPVYDIDGDGDIDLFDAVALLIHYGEKYP